MIDTTYLKYHLRKMNFKLVWQAFWEDLEIREILLILIVVTLLVCLLGYITEPRIIAPLIWRYWK